MSDLMRKHEMPEENIKLQFITPAIEGAGWDRQRQIRMECNFTNRRVIVCGNVAARGRKNGLAICSTINPTSHWKS